MAKVNIVRWDEANLLPQLLSEADTAMINHIDVTGSAGTLTIGDTDATEIVLGNSTNLVLVSASLSATADFTASAGADIYPILHVTGAVDLPGQTSFSLDGVAITTENLTAPNLDTLLNGSNADALHVHSLAVTDLSGSTLKDVHLVHTFTTQTVMSGTDVVYMTSDPDTVALADSDTVTTSRLIGLVTGSTAVVYVSGASVPVQTVYGDHHHDFSGLTPGAVYYLDTTPGQITTTPAPGGGRTIVQVGIATTATDLLYQPDIVVRGLS